LSKIWFKSSAEFKKPFREGEHRSRRKLGLSPEFKAEDLPVRTSVLRLIVVPSSEPVPVVEATTPELPRDSQKAEVGTPVVPTPTIDSAIVDDVVIATIRQGEVTDKHCVSLFVVDEVDVAAEQVSEAIVAPIFPVSKRGWYQWFDGAALAVGIPISNGVRYFLKSDEISKFRKGLQFRKHLEKIMFQCFVAKIKCPTNCGIEIYG